MKSESTYRYMPITSFRKMAEFPDGAIAAVWQAKHLQALSPSAYILNQLLQTFYQGCLPPLIPA